MRGTREIGIVIGVTLLLIVGLGVWEAYRANGTLFSPPPVENHAIPAALPKSDAQSPETTMNQINAENPTVVLKTSEGDITIELYADLMPITAGNFRTLVENDFYDSTKFHRVINGFMIQGGDPNSKTDAVETYGRGGPGYAIEDEHVADPKLSNVRGTISMANSGPNSGGSQFFINLVDNTGLDFNREPLSSKHPVFGRVIAGMDVVDRIAEVPTDGRDLPLTPVVVLDAVVE